MFQLHEAGVAKVFRNFLSNRTQRVKIDSECSSSIDFISGVPRVLFLVLLPSLLCIAYLPGLLQIMLVGYADDSTLFCRILHHSDWASVAASLNDDLSLISAWFSR